MTNSQHIAVQRITVLGGGSFGTVIANMLADNGHSVTLWLRDPERASAVAAAHENTPYLPGYALNHALQITSDLKAALADSTVVFISVPSKSFRSVLQQAKPFVSKDAVLVSTAKGIEESTFKLMSQVAEEEFPAHPIAVISGPNLAREIAQHQLTGTVVASKQPAVCAQMQTLLHSRYFRVYSNDDVYGVELGGVLKNIYAIVAGMGVALGLGHNTLSMLITRSLAEMGRFAITMGANPMTFIGLAGAGDLIVTCMSPLSRNYRIGYALGQGKSVQDAIKEVGQVAEGINTLKLVKEKADSLGVYMPLATGLYEIVYRQRDIAEVLSSLMSAEHNSDVDYSMLINANEKIK